MAENALPPSQESPLQNNDARDLQNELVKLYSELVGHEKVEYEKLHGEQSEEDFLQVLAYAESLRWLDILSRMIAMLQLSDAAPGYGMHVARVVARRVGGLVKSQPSIETDFPSHYQRHVSASEEISKRHDQLLVTIQRISEQD